jgi:hypothetical protein
MATYNDNKEPVITTVNGEEITTAMDVDASTIPTPEDVGSIQVNGEDMEVISSDNGKLVVRGEDDGVELNSAQISVLNGTQGSSKISITAAEAVSGEELPTGKTLIYAPSDEDVEAIKKARDLFVNESTSEVSLDELHHTFVKTPSLRVQSWSFEEGTVSTPIKVYVEPIILDFFMPDNTYFSITGAGGVTVAAAARHSKDKAFRKIQTLQPGAYIITTGKFNPDTVVADEFKIQPTDAVLNDTANHKV